MRYRTQSANVLNEADRFQAILDWQLFTHEQDARLFDSPVAEDWRPGDPLHQDPRWILREDLGCHCADCVENLEQPRENYDGNTVRPMIQEFVDGNGALDPVCPRCEVWWSVKKEPECFICGKDFSFLIPEPAQPLGIWRHTPPPVERLWGGDFDGDSIFREPDLVLRDVITAGLEREMGGGWRSLMNSIMRSQQNVYRAISGMTESMRGLTAQFVIYDEARLMRPYAEADVEWTRTHQLWLNMNRIEEFHPPTPPPNPFESPGDEIRIELVPPVAVEPPVPPVYTTRAGMRVVEAMRAAGPEIFERPAPPVPTFETPQYVYQGNYARNTINQPITEQRRRRNL